MSIMLVESSQKSQCLLPRIWGVLKSSKVQIKEVYIIGWKGLSSPGSDVKFDALLNGTLYTM